MRIVVFVTLLWLAACGQNDAVNSATDAMMGDGTSDSDATLPDAGGDADIDTAIPDPPAPLAPCEATACRHAELGGPPCSGFSQSDSFTAEFGVHAYSSMVWDGAATSVRVTTTGDWTPTIVLARLNGEVLFDGDVGAVRPPFDVTAESPSHITVETSQATGIVVYVTSAEALASDFEVAVPEGATYELTIDSDCGGDRLTCLIDDRNIGEPECGWLHYIGKRVMTRLDGTRDERLRTASRVAWWSLRQDLMTQLNPIVRSVCGGQDVGPLDDCTAATWRVGLSDVEVQGQSLAELEALASRLYDGAMPSGVLRSTANEAALAREDAAAVMDTTGALRASWLLRNTAVGFSVQEPWVTATCVDGMDAQCYGSDSAGARYYALDRETALRSIDSLYALFDEMAE